MAALRERAPTIDAKLAQLLEADDVANEWAAVTVLTHTEQVALARQIAAAAAWIRRERDARRNPPSSPPPGGIRQYWIRELLDVA